MRGVRDVLESKGIFSSFYSDRGPHYWSTPKAGGRVDKENLTQFGRAMRELGIVMIPGYSPEARGRSERMFETLQGRLPAELCELGIVEMEEANRFLRDKFVPDFNRRFMAAPAEEGSAFVPLLGVGLDNILCLKHPRVVGNDNCVSYKGKRLQIPPVEYRYHFVKAKVMVHEYSDGSMAIYHGKRRVGSYDSEGRLKSEGETSRAKVHIGGHRSFRFLNDMSLNASHPDVKVNFLVYHETSAGTRKNPESKTKRFSWVTNIALNPENAMKVMRAGRARWRVENETFNTLKNQGYNFEHNFGHGNKHLATVFGCLMVLAFLIDQIETRCCPMFRAALKKEGRLKYLRSRARGFFRDFIIADWQTLYNSIIHGQKAVLLEPDTS